MNVIGNNYFLRFCHTLILPKDIARTKKKNAFAIQFSTERLACVKHSISVVNKLVMEHTAFNDNTPDFFLLIK